VTLKWEALPGATGRGRRPRQRSDVVVAFVGLSPQLEGEEMSLKIDGFTAATAPASICPSRNKNSLKPWRHRQAAGGGPAERQRVALNWANQHAGAISRPGTPASRRQRVAHPGRN